MSINIPQLAHSIEMLKDSVLHRTYYSMPHIGEYKFSIRNQDYNGWLKCDGRVLNIEDYRGLFDIVGSSFGNTGEGTFSLPNIQGRIPGVIGTSTAGNHPLGQEVGEETHTLTVGELPAHNHSITDPGHTHSGDKYPSTTQTTDDVFGTELAANETIATGNVNSSTTGITINNTGSNTPHNVMQPTIFVGNMFIFGGLRPFYVDPIQEVVG